MFSTGQLGFAIFFVIAFIAIIIYSYRKDLPLHKKYYKGSYRVLLGFLVFIALLVAAKFALKS
ncbi:hypothetical protein N9572_01765 [Flavobacteriaceae bacterium]|jgi:hypothetical protein|nr:hypothetical protein [Bacteroidota bacterium]MDA8971375.1 hypothetical protein [Flavobacteriaceae bacterium]MDB4303094.1 hypothetical protein [bacterium]MDG1501784.1 hypothetical protein [Ulvibacter sp.]MBT5870135.1 hypothetical protein [Bacteroidota bacterium]|tara:strand:- start:678 stop:866 length:189 start_codon:yes stop_codon:yes gene_type:complete